MISNELHESEGVTVTLELEVKTLSILDNSDGLLVSFVLQDKLLQKQKCPLVVYTLSHLHLTGPGMWGPRLFTVVTLSILNHKLNAKRLLEHRIVLYFLLHGQLKFNSATMGLCPNEFGIQ